MVSRRCVFGCLGTKAAVSTGVQRSPYASNPWDARFCWRVDGDTDPLLQRSRPGASWVLESLSESRKSARPRLWSHAPPQVREPSSHVVIHRDSFDAAYASTHPAAARPSVLFPSSAADDQRDGLVPDFSQILPYSKDLAEQVCRREDGRDSRHVSVGSWVWPSC